MQEGITMGFFSRLFGTEGGSSSEPQEAPQALKEQAAVFDQLGPEGIACIPADWKGFRVTRKFRGKLLSIEVKNENGREKGVSQIILNGDKMVGIFIPDNWLKNENTVVVIM